MAKLPNITTHFSEWYLDVIAQAQLADHGPVRGSMVIRPYGYAIWEHIKAVLDAEFKNKGVQNAYFPLLIPESFLKKEAKHVEGFAPELAVVTHAGGKKLEEPLVVRPTSETIVYHMFSKWITSYRDLPLKLNQWANVVRWELRPRLFLRTSEFLWQEGHTAHATQAEAEQVALEMHEVYVSFIEDYLAIAVVKGEKTETERFGGADHTFTLEAMMQDGKALQMGTTHILSQSFSKAFDINFQDRDGIVKSPHCTSWGMTTRLIGAIIMVHGDERGLILPPRIAPLQVVIVPIYRKDDERDAVVSQALKIKEELKNLGIRVEVDVDDTKSPGAKFFHWEVRGVPVRLEIGPRDVAAQSAMVVNRAGGDKVSVPFNALHKEIPAVLEYIQAQLLQKSQERMQKRWQQGEELKDFGPTLEKENGFFQTGWCQSADCEGRLREFKGTIRCVLTTQQHKKCFACDKKSTADVLVAKAY